MNLLARIGLGLGAAMAWLGVYAADTNTLRPWNDYRVIMWVSDSAYRQPEKVPLFFQRLREMGVNTAMVHGDGNLQPLLTNQFPYYVENMVNKGLCLKFSSNVRDWDKFVTGWAKGGRPESAFVRDYSFDDPEWRGWARRQMQSLVRKNMANAPLAYDIRDELSTTISANPFDYDFSPTALAGFRTWLKTQYGTNLAALNAQWETKFATWDEVKPFSTDRIKNRMASGDALPRGNPDWQAVQRLKFDPVTARQKPTRWNFSPWCDFRTYMDLSLARTLGDLRDAARELDPRTPVGIEGTQMPSAFGGYDLWRLSQVLDWVEPYDIGNAREIFGSFMPGKPMMTTVFEKDTNHASRRLWHLLLEGDRGCIIWWSEDCLDWKSPDYALTAKARALSPVLKEMTLPLAELFLRATKEHDPILIHYSQPDLQVNWLMESTVDGSTWLRRFSSHEASHNRHAVVRNGWLKALQDLGYSPRFVSSEQILQGALDDAVALISTDALVSDDAVTTKIFQRGAQQENRAPKAFTWFRSGGYGMFDPRGRLRAARLDGEPAHYTGWDKRVNVSFNRMTLAMASREGSAADYARTRLTDGPSSDWPEWIRKYIALKPAVELPPAARTRIHRYRLGPARLVAFERNINYHMSEDLKQAGGNEVLEKPVELDAKLAAPAHAYDLRTGAYLGRTDRLKFTLHPWQPSLFALLEEKLPAGDIVGSLGAFIAK